MIRCKDRKYDSREDEADVSAYGREVRGEGGVVQEKSDILKS